MCQGGKCVCIVLSFVVLALQSFILNDLDLFAFSCVFLAGELADFHR